jgi:hypothetical protein
MLITSATSSVPATSTAAEASPMDRGLPRTDREALERTLDDMRRKRHLLFGKYVILGGCERRGGGQGLVQFVHDASRTQLSYAVKFFTNSAAFEHECTLYADETLRAMMAATREVGDNADACHTMSDGRPFPPYIVIERGEPLDEWTVRMRTLSGQSELDLVAAFQALINIARRLMTLHEAGYVHCDVKPSNVLWLARPFTWTLIDFGSTVREGMA